MKIALAQLNPIIGDVQGNSRLVRAAAESAAVAGADLLVTPELAVSGYPPKDLLLREGFVAACDRYVQRLAQEIPPHLGLIVGHPTHLGVPAGQTANGASLLSGGKIQQTIHKTLLPNYDVFDERRYFLPAKQLAPIEYQGLRLGVHICEDAWYGESGTAYHVGSQNDPDPIAALQSQGIDCLINLSASPFEADKPQRREGIVQRHAKRAGIPFLFVNQVGGNDDLVFDGQSLIANARGEIVGRLLPFAPETRLVNLQQLPTQPLGWNRIRPQNLLDALVLGLRDYAQKSGFRDCVLGLSGGIDSALAAYIAAQALGPEHVHGLAMPSRYSSGHSVADAAQLAGNLGIDFQVIPIDEVHRSYESLTLIGEDLKSQPAGLADQNLQARIRGACVMVRSNRYGWLALATGNKSELAVGYCTLYGDMAGGFAVLSDIFKQDVYSVAHYINDTRERRVVIPQGSLEKPPSAELAPNQFDQDTLPPYPVLDGILEGLIEDELSVETLSKHFPPETVRWVQQRLDRNEFKRRQMPPGIKLSQRAFGSGRRMPMAARFRWDVEEKDEGGG